MYKPADSLVSRAASCLILPQRVATSSQILYDETLVKGQTAKPRWYSLRRLCQAEDSCARCCLRLELLRCFENWVSNYAPFSFLQIRYRARTDILETKLVLLEVAYTMTTCGAAY